MRSLVIILLLLKVATLNAQVVNTATMDTSDYKVKGKITFEGYIDTYYAYNFNEPKSNDQPYYVSMSRHNEVNINLAFIDIKYTSSKVRARLAPGFGTYMTQNYSSETGSLKNLVEANAGFRIVKSKNIWLDAGILGSPYTNESAISKDHLIYTRSFAAENVPYYLSGAKLTVPVSRKLNAYLYLINGWQQITDQNSNKAVGTQLEFRPVSTLLINWNTFIGKEKALKDSTNGNRYFTDIYFIYKQQRTSFTGCFYYGFQRNKSSDFNWMQANIASRYDFTNRLSGSLRLEYFSDEKGVLVLPVTHASHFETFGMSVGLNVNLDDNIWFRTEAKQLISREPVYMSDSEPTSKSLITTGSICAWF
jgi:hypothetical protein